VSAVQPGRLKRGLFDWDGNFSRLRMGWERVMAPMMVNAICGAKEPDSATASAVDRYISDTTGIRTIEQMRGLVDMVREAGNVPEAEVLDAWGYKRMYLEALMVPVNQRIAEIANSGSFMAQNMQIPGSLLALKALTKLGVRLDGFSGTDEPDVICESEVLKLRQFFASIHGAAVAHNPGEPEIDKADVLRAVLSEDGVDNSQVFGGGDGPVEIRVLKESGCLAIGVASDEEHCSGCFEPKKFKRLLDAGADVIMPDWRYYGALIKHVLKLA